MKTRRGPGTKTGKPGKAEHRLAIRIADWNGLKNKLNAGIYCGYRCPVQ